MLSQVSFYHVTSSDLEKSSCRLLEKIFNANLKALVLTADPTSMDSLNKVLWTFSSKSFIPHGSISDPSPELQPILITSNIESHAGNYDILVCYNCIPSDSTNFSRLIYIFHDHDEQSVLNARQEYKKYKDQNISLDYHKQQEDGAWQ